MIIPGSHAAILLLLVLGMLGWGVWANTFKATGGKWRFELFYFDFAIGVVILATVLALTAGSLGFDGFSFSDDLRLAGKRQDAFGLAAGIIFNLGNMLLLAAVSIAGMAVAFPIALGFALIVASLWNFALNPGGNAIFLAAGAAVVAGAIVLAIFAFKAWATANLLAAAAEQPQPVKGKARRKKASLKSIFLGLAGGLMLGSFMPLLQLGRAGENGLGPYSIGFIFSIGVLFSTFVFNLFFMNLPVQGEPIEMAEYFRARLSRHGTGILGGLLWYTGIITTMIGDRAEGAARVSGSLRYALSHGGMVLAALCGLLLWKEMADAGGSVKVRLWLVLLLLVVGIGLSSASVAPAP